jgi:hypothetical protein
MIVTVIRVQSSKFVAEQRISSQIWNYYSWSFHRQGQTYFFQGANWICVSSNLVFRTHWIPLRIFCLMISDCKPTYTPKAEIYETLSEVSEIRDTCSGMESWSLHSTFTVWSFCKECKTTHVACYGKTGGYLLVMLPASFQTIFVFKLLDSFEFYLACQSVDLVCFLCQ